MPARGAAAAEHGEQRQRRREQLEQSVTLVTGSESVHESATYFNIPFSEYCARASASPLNLIAVISVSSFHVRVHSVNALTEELDHIRFSVRRVAGGRKLSLRI
jgi:hypothetical protein